MPNTVFPARSANQPLLDALLLAIESCQPIIERLAGSKYFLFLFAGDEILLDRGLLDEFEAFIKEDFVVISNLTNEQAWPRSQAMQFFSQADWSKAVSSGKTKLSFTEWQSSQVASLPLLKAVIGKKGKTPQN